MTAQVRCLNIDDCSLEKEIPEISKGADWHRMTFALDVEFLRELLCPWICFLHLTNVQICSAENEHISVKLFDTSRGPCFTVNMTAMAEGEDTVFGLTAIFHLNENKQTRKRRDAFYDPTLQETHAAGKAHNMEKLPEKEYILVWNCTCSRQPVTENSQNLGTLIPRWRLPANDWRTFQGTTLRHIKTCPTSGAEFSC